MTAVKENVYPLVERFYMGDKVAVIISPSFGGGWSTEYPLILREFLCMDSVLVKALISESRELVNSIAEGCLKGWGEHFHSHNSPLELRWVKRGTLFQITNYDGAETLTTLPEMEFLQA